MVRKIAFKDLEKITIENRITVALFYSRGCKVCESQEEEVSSIEKNLASHGVKFVKVQLKPAIEKSMGVHSVPTTMMWIKGGINVAYRFEPEGKIFSQINGKVDANTLLKKITILLNQYS